MATMMGEGPTLVFSTEDARRRRNMLRASSCVSSRSNAARSLPVRACAASTLHVSPSRRLRGVCTRLTPGTIVWRTAAVIQLVPFNGSSWPTSSPFHVVGAKQRIPVQDPPVTEFVPIPDEHTQVQDPLVVRSVLHPLTCSFEVDPTND